MDPIRQDIRFALRSLGQAPAFTAIAALCIALGIAACVYVFSPVNTLLLKSLPFRDADGVMHLSTYPLNGQRGTHGSWSYPDYADLAASRGTFSEVGAWSQRSWNVGGIGEPERLDGARVSASLFPLLGLQPALGRWFRPEEDAAGKVVILGYGVWQRKYGADPSIIGRAVTVNSEPYTVVGVMARGVRFPEQGDIWLPLEPGDARGHREWRFYQVVARLVPGVSEAQANERLATFMATLAARSQDTNRGTSAWLQPMKEDIAGEVRPIFLIMLGAVGFVLLIACANVANLLLARGSGRQREMAVRQALGASRLRLVRQLLTESLILAVLGGVLGALLGTWLVDYFTTRMLPTTIPYWMTFGVDRTVLLLTFAVTLAAGLIFGIAPAVHLSQPSLSETLKESGGRGSSAHRRAGRTRSALVVVELALSLVLLVGAGLMAQSFLRTQRASLGFDARNLLTFQLALAGGRYANDTARVTFQRVLHERLAAIPGVSATGAVGNLPISSCCNHTRYFPEGKDYPPAEGPTSYFNGTSPSFFAAMRVPLRAGRFFGDADTFGAPPVAIVDEVFAKREWPGESAVGRRVRLSAADTTWVTIVGVVPHIVQRHVTERADAQLYRPLVQAGFSSMSFVLRASADPVTLVQAAKDVVRSLDPDLPLSHLQSMDGVIRDRMFEPRVYGTMFAIFAMVALLLASIGLYGVMSYAVAQRTHEMGVRMALGARGKDVVALIMRGGTRMIVGGLLIGVPAAFGLARLLQGTLYGVSASDPLTFLVIPLALTVVALVASYLPARRATRVDPIVALRSE